ncbi:uncharacterized protein L199_008215 [Kwoniella botswanensis]|uniref:uncharacterized protein n=1 Tax=Kwoniella botswanensis TaxID=1268659 RepID=UPI00315DA0D9
MDEYTRLPSVITSYKQSLNTGYLQGTNTKPDIHFCKNVFDQLASRASILVDEIYRINKTDRKKCRKALKDIQSNCHSFSADTEEWKTFFNPSIQSDERTWLYQHLEDAISNYDSAEEFKQLLIGTIKTDQPDESDVKLLSGRLKSMAQESLEGEIAQDYLESQALSFLRERNEWYKYLQELLEMLEDDLNS